MGEEKYMIMKEVTEDKSAPYVQKKANQLFDAMKTINKETDRSLKMIHSLQSDILKSVGVNLKATGENTIVTDRDPNSNIDPISYNLANISHVKSERKFDRINSKNIQELLKNLRKVYIEIMVASAFNSDEEKYYFTDPDISTYSSFKDLNTQIAKSIVLSNVSPDDEEILKKIYSDLTITISTIEKSFESENDWLTNFELLLYVESEILKARNDVFSAIRYRVSGDNYSFNKILATVNGPAVVRKGEKITIEVCMAAYDTDKQPIVRTGNGVLLETKEGKGLVEISGDKPGYKTVRGTITIMNKSGIPKTLPWEKEVYVTN